MQATTIARFDQRRRTSYDDAERNAVVFLLWRTKNPLVSPNSKSKVSLKARFRVLDVRAPILDGRGELLANSIVQVLLSKFWRASIREVLFAFILAKQ